MTHDGYQRAGKRRRENTEQNTGQSDSDQQRLVRMLSNGYDKLNIIFDAIEIIRNNQEKAHQGMLSFQIKYRCMDKNIHNNIQAANRNTDILKTVAYKSIDQEARSSRNNLIFWGLAENLGVKKPNLRGQRRPIIVNFSDFRDTELLMSRTYMLRNTRFSINYDLPKEIGDAPKRIWSDSERPKKAYYSKFQ